MNYYGLVPNKNYTLQISKVGHLNAQQNEYIFTSNQQGIIFLADKPFPVGFVAQQSLNLKMEKDAIPTPNNLTMFYGKTQSVYGYNKSFSVDVIKSDYQITVVKRKFFFIDWLLQ